MFRNRCIYYRVLAVILIYISILVISDIKVVVANTTMTDIRIGLTSIYSQKNSIKIRNKKIGMGYSIDNIYKQDNQLYSETGFTFALAKGNFFKLNKTYGTFQEAKKVALTIKKLGVKAYPAVIYRNYYTVYVGGDTSDATISSVYSKIEGRYGYTYSSLGTDNKHRMYVNGSDDSFVIDAEKMGAYPQFKGLASNGTSAIVLNLGERSYRGRIEIGRYGKEKITAVNIVNMEAYLYGVVPAEMVSSWPMEALKAQAVCARGFALSKTTYGSDSNAKIGYYLNDTTNHQVYKGYSVEQKATTKAVNATKGEVVTYEGKMITPFYSSTSGGKTENGFDVWGLKVPYYQSVTDTYENNPEKGPWIISYSKNEIRSKLTKLGFKVGNVESIAPEIITSSNRVYSLRIKGNLSSATLQSGSVRSILDLYSTKFKIIEYGDSPNKVVVLSKNGKSNMNIKDSYILSGKGIVQKANKNLEQYIVKGANDLMNYPVNAPKNRDIYYFAGMGFGHGIGLSQSGARGMAEEGFDYQEIISYYFTGCKVQKR